MTKPMRQIMDEVFTPDIRVRLIGNRIHTALPLTPAGELFLMENLVAGLDYDEAFPHGKQRDGLCVDSIDVQEEYHCKLAEIAELALKKQEELRNANDI